MCKVACGIRASVPRPALLITDARNARQFSSAQKLAVHHRSERRQTREEKVPRPKKLNQYAQSPKLNKPADTRRRPPRSRRRHRVVPPRDLVLPDLGLTSEQLGALAGTPEHDIFKCAKDLDDSVHDVKALLSPALVELVTEEMELNVVFRPQTTPLFPADKHQAIVASSTERRMPVITVMGHVDHGKTSLLDALRNSDVAEREVGGITQSVAAFSVPISTKSDNAQQSELSFATFIDTPGHAAFKAMRANGTVGTDIVILVVAADDGVMPQTVEAAELARSASVPIIVAVNKCDVPGADPEKVRFQLLQRLGINTEQLGGDVQCVDISAKTGSNLSQLLESASLQAELLDLRTKSDAAGHAICLESRADKALGSVATVVVRMGTIRKGDHIVFQSPRALHGHLYGRIRGLLGSDSASIDKAGPGIAVGVIGIKEIIPPGAEVQVVSTEKEARSISQHMISRNSAAISTIQTANSLFGEIEQRREAEQKDMNVATEDTAAPNLDESQNDAEDSKPDDKRRTLVVLIKGDVKGSADAVAHCIQALGSAEVPVRIIGANAGDVTERDIQLASATNKVKGNEDPSLIIAFNVRTRDSISKLAKRARLPILEHSLIYHLEDDVKERIEEILADQRTSVQVLGNASVIRIFEEGSIAGCTIDDGIVSEGDTARVMRLPDVHSSLTTRQEIYSGPIESIKRFAKSTRSVKKGTECGICIKEWSGFVPGDQIECISTS